MAVSRKGKRGSRGHSLRPSSRNKRVLYNARVKNMTKNAPTLVSLPKRSREEIILDIVNQESGHSGSYLVDDFASDLILELWQERKFGEDFDAVREYVRAGIRRAIRRAEGQLRCEVDCYARDRDRSGKIELRPIDSFHIRSWTKPLQELRIEAGEALALAKALPTKQRDCLLIMADGGNPFDVANDMGMKPWDAIRLIKEAREYVHRVDGIDEAA